MRALFGASLKMVVRDRQALFWALIFLQVFGLSQDNARAFWNWKFLGETPDLPKTRAMLMRACDTRLPARSSFVPGMMLSKTRPRIAATAIPVAPIASTR